MRGGDPTVAERRVGKICGAGDRLGDAAAVPHRGAGPLDRLHREGQALRGKVLPLEIDLVLHEQALDQGQPLDVAADAPLVVEVHDLELVLGPAGRHAENQPPARDDIEIGGLLSHVQRVEKRQDQHAGRQRHAFRGRREAGQQFQRREPGG